MINSNQTRSLRTSRVMTIMLFLIIAVSCSKLDEAPVTVQDSTPKNQDGDFGFILLYMPDHPLGFCAFSGKNCWWPPIETTPTSLSTLDDYIDSGASGVQEYFSDSSLWINVFPGLSDPSNTKFLEKLQSGNYTMEKKPAQDNLLHYIAKGGDPEEMFVFQVK